ncbi:amino-acid biosynthesis [Rhodopirellula islandica]|uniref:Amino-acid biosynthesis n=1 Tax=Rhodopirellula islandica TaxID=595434 RepID=A0A0J1BKD9_RHOIS|nr:aminotransferase class IV [Rhodopirellula islandica]KLU06977.1 amino-acid biosynthesis [Rhodopirellula islandica]
MPIDDLGFRQGVTAVERLRTYGGVVFCPELHLQRLSETLRLIKIAGGPSTETLRELIAECLRQNAELVQQMDVGMTIWVTGGSRPSGPTWAVHLNPIDHRAVTDRQLHGQPVVITEVVQPPNESWPRHAKVRNRLHYYLADLEAKRQNPAATGVLLDADGSVTESNVANVAIVEDGHLVFPPQKSVLKGVTMHYLRQQAARMGITCQEAPLMPLDLHQADEVLLMGTDTGVWFASSLGYGRPVFQRGCVCSQLQACFPAPATGEGGAR